MGIIYHKSRTHTHNIITPPQIGGVPFTIASIMVLNLLLIRVCVN